MDKTESIPTKFTVRDVEKMDKLVQRGMYLSRSDIIRTATRNAIKQESQSESEQDKFVRTMKEKGDLNSIEGKVLAKILLNKEGVSMKGFSDVEQKTVRKLKRHPAGLLRVQKSKLVLTGFGESAARGYIKALTHAKTLF